METKLFFPVLLSFESFVTFKSKCRPAEISVRLKSVCVEKLSTLHKSFYLIKTTSQGQVIPISDVCHRWMYHRFEKNSLIATSVGEPQSH